MARFRENENQNQIIEKVHQPIGTIDSIVSQGIEDPIDKYILLAALFCALRQKQNPIEILNLAKISNDMRTELAAPLSSLIGATNDMVIGDDALKVIREQEKINDTLVSIHSQFKCGMIDLIKTVTEFGWNEEQKNQFVAGWLGAVINNKIGTFYEQNNIPGDLQDQLQGTLVSLRGSLESDSSKYIMRLAIIKQGTIYREIAWQGVTR